MNFAHKEIKFNTKGCFEFIDLTEKAKEFVGESGVENGLFVFQTTHTTTAIIVNENEPLLLQDFKRFLEDLAPQSKFYTHDDFSIRTVNMCTGECANGHSHCKAIILPPSSPLIIKNGQLRLGVWQRIIFIELDRPRPRKVEMAILGE